MFVLKSQEHYIHILRLNKHMDTKNFAMFVYRFANQNKTYEGKNL